MIDTTKLTLQDRNREIIYFRSGNLNPLAANLLGWHTSRNLLCIKISGEEGVHIVQNTDATLAPLKPEPTAIQTTPPSTDQQRQDFQQGVDFARQTIFEELLRAQGIYAQMHQTDNHHKYYYAGKISLLEKAWKAIER